MSITGSQEGNLLPLTNAVPKRRFLKQRSLS